MTYTVAVRTGGPGVLLGGREWLVVLVGGVFPSAAIRLFARAVARR